MILLVGGWFLNRAQTLGGEYGLAVTPEHVQIDRPHDRDEFFSRKASKAQDETIEKMRMDHSVSVRREAIRSQIKWE